MTTSGRREGSRTVHSVWWKAEVISIEIVEGKCKAQLKYDEKDGFAQQVGHVWMFPRHVRVVGEEDTQLKWRLYECSGKVSYDLDGGESMVLCTTPKIQDVDEEWQSVRFTSLEEKVADLYCRFESLERLVIAQAEFHSRLLGEASTGDRRCSSMFSLLRQKVAILMQKQIPNSKYRKDADEGDCFHETCCTGCLRTDVDCNLQDFGVLARVVQSRTEDAHFRPSYEHTQSHSADIDSAETLFGSLSALCNVIGIIAYSDMLCMAFREKGIPKDKNKASLDASIRVLGTLLYDETSDMSPSAVLVCGSIDEKRTNETVEALVRSSCEFDFAAMTYNEALRYEKTEVRSLLSSIFAARIEGRSQEDELKEISNIIKNISNFTLRWRPVPASNARVWTRGLIFSGHVSGILEIEFPYIIFRGHEAVSEVLNLVSESYLRRRLRSQIIVSTEYPSVRQCQGLRPSTRLGILYDGGRAERSCCLETNPAEEPYRFCARGVANRPATANPFELCLCADYNHSPEVHVWTFEYMAHITLSRNGIEWRELRPQIPAPYQEIEGVLIKTVLAVPYLLGDRIRVSIHAVNRKVVTVSVVVSLSHDGDGNIRALRWEPEKPNHDEEVIADDKAKDGEDILMRL